MRELASGVVRYKAAIEELAASRAECSDEASLFVWISTEGRDGAEAANDVLTGRVGQQSPTSPPPLGFSQVIAELQADAEHLANHPVTHDEPQPRPNFALIRRAS